MKTLEQLQSGSLQGVHRLNLSCELRHVPEEIFDLADSLEVLDLSHNSLSSLPDQLPRLHRLKAIFLNNNQFETVPEVLAQCPQLSIISFKSNYLTHLSETALPLHTRWLILTNNQLTALPATLGKLSKLQKLMLAGNRLQSIPDALSACLNLELIRIAANQLTSLPQWLLTMPRLAWLACAGNPCCAQRAAAQHCPTHLDHIDWADLDIGEKLGQGASGIIYQGVWKNGTVHKDVAVKVFKGEVTSDGLPEDEMRACIAAGPHQNLVSVLGKVINHPDHKEAVVFPFIPSSFKTLGGPPNLESCTRDTYQPNQEFPLGVSLQIIQSIAAALSYLHSRGILHGDLYAHNILTRDSGDSYLGDFGAAAFYDPADPTWGPGLQRLEARAFGCLLDDLLTRCPPSDRDRHPEVYEQLLQLRQACTAPTTFSRPLITSICNELGGLTI